MSHISDFSASDTETANGFEGTYRDFIWTIRDTSLRQQKFRDIRLWISMVGGIPISHFLSRAFGSALDFRRTDMWSSSPPVNFFVLRISLQTFSWTPTYGSLMSLYTLLLIVYSLFFSLALRPPWALASAFSFMIVLQTVGLFGRVISSSQGLYLNTGQHKHRINTYTHQTFMPCGDSNPRSQLPSERR
jgi:hypothetical protein